MYRIVGAYGKEYGPAAAEQLGQWLAEGRVNARTLGQAEGSNVWQALATFPEFAASLVNPAVPPPIGAAPTSISARAANKIAAGICGVLLGGFGIHKFILGYTGTGLIMLLVTVLTCGWGGIVMGIIGLIGKHHVSREIGRGICADLY